MGKPVCKHLRQLALGGAALLGMAGQAQSAGLAPPAIYAPGPALGSLVPDGQALLIWGPLLLLTTLCIGALLLLIRMQDGGTRLRSSRRRSQGLGTARGRGLGWQPRFGAAALSKRRPYWPMALWLAAGFGAGSSAVSNLPAAPADAAQDSAQRTDTAGREEPSLISAAKR